MRGPLLIRGASLAPTALRVRYPRLTANPDIVLHEDLCHPEEGEPLHDAVSMVIPRRSIGTMEEQAQDEGRPQPRAFISYSWSSPGHQARIRQWAEQLVADGVDVILDIWDLNEGDDKYAFMEKIVTDKSVSHVLVFCDLDYATKSDARKAGVGTESQIISREVYDKVRQSKFIPIACEFDSDGEPCLPTFLKSRIWIDFSSPEAANEHWEQLVRVLYGKPAFEKPTPGKPPAYIGQIPPPQPVLQ